MKPTSGPNHRAAAIGCSAHNRRRGRCHAPLARYLIEPLEDRTLLAFNMALSVGPTANVTTTTALNTTTFTATGTGANLDWVDVASALGAGRNVVISSGATGAEAGKITDQTGIQTTFSASNLSLSIQSGSGSGLVGDINIKSIYLGGTSSSLVLGAHGSITTGALSGGNFANPAPLAGATLSAATGSVTAQLSPFPGSIEAGIVAIQANTGIGSSTNSLPTQAGNLSARTATGGVFITNTGSLNINGGVISGVNGVQVTTSGSVSLVTSGNFTATTNGDIVQAPAGVSITTTAAGNILLGGDNGAGFDIFTGTVASSGGTVTLNAAGNLLIGNTADPVYTYSYGDVEGGGSIVMIAGGNLTVDNDSLISAHGTGAITATAGGSISLLHTNLSPTEFVTQGGTIGLTTGAGGTLTINGGATQSLATNRNGGSGNISITADHLLLNASTDGITAAAGIVTIQPVSYEPIQLGTATDAELDLSNAELGAITAGILRLGSTAYRGSLTVTSPIGPAHVSTLSLQTSYGTVGDSAPADTTTVGNLALRAGGGINLDTVATNVAFQDSLGGSVRIANSGAMNITSVDILNGTAANQIGNFASGGTTTISASSPITFAIPTTSVGTLTATASDTAATHFDNISVNAGVTVASTGGDVVLQAGDDVIINGTVQAPAGNVDFHAGNNDNDNEGTITINGTVSASNTVALRVSSTNSSLSGGTADIGEGAGGTIAASGLLLVDSPGSGTSGPIVLDASANNAVGTIAASAKAAIAFRDSTALTVGTVSSPSEGITSFGIYAAPFDLTLGTGGSLSLTQALNAQDVRLNAAGSVAQTAAGVITTNTLGVLAGGGINLAVPGAPNAVLHVAAKAAGAGATVQFLNNGTFTVDAVSSLGIFPGASGVSTNNGNVDLVSNTRTIALNAPVNAGTGTVRLQAGTSATPVAAGFSAMFQFTPGSITAANLSAVAFAASLAGSIDLSAAPNHVSGAFAASNSGPGSYIRFVNTGGFSVLGIASDAIAVAAPQVTTSGGDVDLVSQMGSITLSNPIHAGTGTVRLSSGTAVLQTGAGIISADSLEAVAAGAVGLAISGAPNSITGSFAALDSAAGAAVQFLNGSALTVGTVAGDAVVMGVSGASTTNGDIDLISAGGAISILQPVNAGAGTVRLQAGTAGTPLAGGPAISQAATGPIESANLSAVAFAGTAAGTVDLSGALNQVTGGLAAFDNGPGAFLRFVNTGGFTTAAVPGDAAALAASQVTLNNGDVDLVSRGGPIALGVMASIGAGIVRLNAAAAVSQTVGGAINAANLALLAAGPVNLGEAANSIPGVVAAQITGAGAAIEFLDGSTFTVGNVAGDSLAFGATGVSTSNGQITLASAGAITVSNPITAGSNTVLLSVGNTGVGSTLTVNAAVSGTGGLTTAGGLGPDAFQFNFSSGATLPNVLTVKSGGGSDTIALNYLSGLSSPLPNILHLSGIFTISGLIGTNPLANTTLEIGASRVFITYAAGADPIAAIRSYLKNGYANGAWNGSPSASTGVITSLAAQADPLHSTGVGSIDFTPTGPGPHPGPGPLIELKYTVYGDANLDGTANLADLLILTRHFGQSAGWDGGDFNYDGAASLADFLTLARHFGQVAPPSPALSDIVAKPTNRSTVRRVSV